jgi:hypothetical protein
VTRNECPNVLNDMIAQFTLQSLNEVCGGLRSPRVPAGQMRSHRLRRAAGQWFIAHMTSQRSAKPFPEN